MTPPPAPASARPRLRLPGSRSSGSRGAAAGPIVELLTDDTEVCPGWADAALAAFAADRIGAVAPLVLRWPGGSADAAVVDSAGDHYHPGGFAGKCGHGQ